MLRLIDLLIAQGTTAHRLTATHQMRGCGSMMHPEHLRQITQRMSPPIGADQLIDLGLAEKGLSFPNRTHHLAPIVCNRRFIGPSGILIQAALPPRCHSFQGMGRVLEPSTEAHIVPIG